MTTPPVCRSGRSSRYSRDHAVIVAEFGVGRGGEVLLDAGVRRERDSEPERQVGLARRGVRAGRAEVRADEFRRYEHARPSFDPGALDGIVAVRGPYPVGAVEDAEVDASAAAGARLDLQPRMARAQLVEQPVERERLRVDERAVSPVARATASSRSRLWSHLR